MGRKRQRGERGRPWYWDVRDCWVITAGKKRVVLRDRNGDSIRGEDNRAAAELVWHETMAATDAPRKGGDNELRVVLDMYLQDLEKRAAPKTLADYTGFFRSFLKRWPGLLVRELKPYHVRTWWDEHPTWGPSYRNMMGTALQAALNWAAEPGKGGEIIPKNPLDGMRLPTCRKRSAAVVVEDGAFDRLMALVRSESIRDVLTVLWETGTRPGNLAIATAANLAPDGNALVFDAHNTPEGSSVHKAFKKTGRALIVPLTDAAREVCVRLRLKRPEGPLFRTPRGLPWNKQRLANIVLYYAKQAGLKGRFMAYSARHSRATAMLQAGESVETVSAVIGNTPSQVARNYSHLPELRGHLRDVLNRHSPAARRATGT
jgi:integrase